MTHYEVSHGREVNSMDSITIGNILMPRTKTLEVGGTTEVKTITMASGLEKQYVIGYRVELSATWEYVPADILAQVVTLARSGGYVSITYPDSEGGAATGNFRISIGNQKIFKFIAGNPMWYNVELTATAQEVLADAGS